MSKFDFAQNMYNNTFFIQFLIDDKVINGVGLPIFDFEESFPYLPPFGEISYSTNYIRVIETCSCGEIGCSQEYCEIIKENDNVVISEYIDRSFFDNILNRVQFDNKDQLKENLREIEIIKSKMYRYEVREEDYRKVMEKVLILRKEYLKH